MKGRITSALAAASFSLALAAPAGAQQSTTLSGKLVDYATYITHDHNMDAMHHMGGAMSGDHAMSPDHAMSGNSMKGDHMMGASCPALGIVTDAGRVYPVAAQMGSPMGADLCKKMNANVTLSGKLYTQGGASVFLVSSLK